MRPRKWGEADMKARLRTQCVCGQMVVIGTRILYDTKKCKTTGCVKCKGDGHPDPHSIGSLPDDWFPIIHGDW